MEEKKKKKDKEKERGRRRWRERELGKGGKRNQLRLHGITRKGPVRIQQDGSHPEAWKRGLVKN